MEPQGNGPEQDAGFVLSDFGVEVEAVADQPPGEETQRVMLNEIVIECPVVIEFVGGGLSPEARSEITLAVMDEIAGAVRRT